MMTVYRRHGVDDNHGIVCVCDRTRSWVGDEHDVGDRLRTVLCTFCRCGRSWGQGKAVGDSQNTLRGDSFWLCPPTVSRRPWTPAPSSWPSAGVSGGGRPLGRSHGRGWATRTPGSSTAAASQPSGPCRDVTVVDGGEIWNGTKTASKRT